MLPVVLEIVKLGPEKIFILETVGVRFHPNAMEANYIHICPSMICGHCVLWYGLTKSCRRHNVVLFLNNTLLYNRLNIL